MRAEHKSDQNMKKNYDFDLKEQKTKRNQRGSGEKNYEHIAKPISNRQTNEINEFRSNRGKKKLIKQSYLYNGLRYLNYLLLLPDRKISIDWLSRGDFVGRGRIRISAAICLGVFDRRSIGELSLFDSVLESGRNISA